ncbi:PEP-CTERM sorting domain-containing protein [Paucibacter sp. KCTC 42545]|uniref:PEP-CTERM sorting domain-containing protein n=1 Tax=Paucibacter sp. KCTC 42545 TaxID=1768242 RepID=UPI000733A294|nr:PEP-CTERM sorting domain-containing protein [Paucibacter sp. KCTC 42545]ALT78092.1 hypothetical protein AT984_13780 [Paucibacter sp. KCTC 42545]
MKISTASRLALLLSLLVSASLAQAASTLSIQFVGEDPNAPVLSTSFSDDYATGRLSYVDAGGRSFYAYCVELQQDFAPASLGMKTYTVGSFSAPQATALQGLFSTSYAGLSNAYQQAAFQVAVWEITHEKESSTFNVSAGNGGFFFAGLSDVSAAGAADLNANFTNQVNSYLAAASDYQGPARYQLTRLDHKGFQDLVVATAVPEPSSYALLLCGLAGMGLIVRRRTVR